jgi:hypothetical protein
MNSNRFLFWVRDRRGAAVVLLIVMLAALLGILSVVIDTSRIMALKAEMQTAVDAGALAGVMALSDGAGDGSRQVAIDYALRNFAEAEGVVVLPEDVTFGIWDRWNWTFNPLPSAAGADAIDVQARRGVVNYLAWILGIPRSGAWARATAWAAAPVSEAPCVKPWALPEELLDLNNDNTVDDWEVDEAIGDEFTLKSAVGGNADSLTSSGLPSFFYPVVLPPFWDATTQDYVDPAPQGGAAPYRENISTCLGELVGVGDSLLVEPGNMPGPTVQGATDLCAAVIDTYCYDADGNIGVKIIAGFWDSDVDPIGRSAVEVATLAAFRLTRVYSQGQHGVIVGIFEEMVTTGAVGPGGSTAVKIILVR